MRRPNKKRLMDIHELVKNPRYLDMGKNILIALLIVSAALLAVKSGLFSLAGGKTEPGQTMQQGQQQTGIAGGAVALLLAALQLVDTYLDIAEKLRKRRRVRKKTNKPT